MPDLSSLTNFQEASVHHALYDLEQYNSIIRHDARMVWFYNQRDSLSNRQKRSFLSLYTRALGTSIDSVAGVYEGYALPNGVFNVLLHDRTIIESFNIHTVQRGELSGQRVIKRKVNGRFKAFGFVTNNSNIKLWRRYEDQENEPQFLLAKALVAHLRNYDESVISWHSYNFNPRCRRCNVEISSRNWYDESEQRPNFCSSCATTHSPAQLYGRMGEEARRDVLGGVRFEQEYRSMMEVNAPSPNATSVTIVEPPSAPRRNLLMSENDPTIVR